MTTQDQNTITPSTFAAGWYPDTQVAGLVRYHDGQAWTQHTAPAVPAAGAPATDALTAPAVATVSEKPKKKRKMPVWAWIGVGVVGLVVVITAAASGGGKGEDAAPADKSAASAPAAEAVEDEAPVTVVMPDVVGMTVADATAALSAVGLTLTPVYLGAEDPAAVATSALTAAGEDVAKGTAVSVEFDVPKPVYTLAQENAIGSAESYLRFSGFSRTGLISQLEYEEFSTEDATFAVDHVTVDWNAEAAESAQSYMEYSSFSRQGLYDQLAYEGFTPEQIESALAAVGY